MRTLLVAIVAFALAGCEAPAQSTRRTVMSNKAPATAGVPPLDTKAPKTLETATFGLG